MNIGRDRNEAIITMEAENANEGYIIGRLAEIMETNKPDLDMSSGISMASGEPYITFCVRENPTNIDQ